MNRYSLAQVAFRAAKPDHRSHSLMWFVARVFLLMLFCAVLHTHPVHTPNSCSSDRPVVFRLRHLQQRVHRGSRIRLQQVLRQRRRHGARRFSCSGDRMRCRGRGLVRHVWRGRGAHKLMRRTFGPIHPPPDCEDRRGFVADTDTGEPTAIPFSRVRAFALFHETILSSFFQLMIKG